MWLWDFFSVYILKGLKSLWLQTIFYKAELVRLNPNPSIFNLIALLEMREEWVLGVIGFSWKITLKSKELQQHIFNFFLLFFSVTFSNSMSWFREIKTFSPRLKFVYENRWTRFQYHCIANFWNHDIDVYYFSLPVSWSFSHSCITRYPILLHPPVPLRKRPLYSAKYF